MVIDGWGLREAFWDDQLGPAREPPVVILVEQFEPVHQLVHDIALLALCKHAALGPGVRVHRLDIRVAAQVAREANLQSIQKNVSLPSARQASFLHVFIWAERRQQLI